MRRAFVVALVFFGCAGEPTPRVVEPVAGPAPSVETKPVSASVEAAAPPPACEVDTLRVFSPDGSRLAVTHESGQILLYDTSSWTLTASLMTGKITRMFFAGRRFVFAEGVAGKKDVYQVRVLDDGFREVFQVSNALTGWQGDQLATSADGAQLVLPVVDESRTPDNPEHVMARVELWEVVAKKKLFEHPLDEDDNVQRLVIGKQGQVLVGATQLLLFAKGQKKPEKSWEYRPDPLPDFSHDGAFLSFRKESVLQVYGLRDKKLRTLKDKDCDGQGAVWSPDDKTLAAGGFSFHVCLFEPKSGRLLSTLPNPRVPSTSFEDEGMREPLAWSRDGRSLVTKGMFEMLVFDAKTGRRYAQPGAATDWNLNDTRVQTRARDGALLVLHQGRLQAHVLGGRLIGDFLEGEAFRQLTVSPSGEKFLRATERVEVVSTERGNVVALEGTEPDKDAYGDLAFWFDPTGKYVISGDGALRVWNAETGKRVGPKRDERCPAR